MCAGTMIPNFPPIFYIALNLWQGDHSSEVPLLFTCTVYCIKDERAINHVPKSEHVLSSRLITDGRVIKQTSLYYIIDYDKVALSQ